MKGCNEAGQHLSPQGKSSHSHVVGGKCPVHMDIPTMIGWIIGGGCTQNEALVLDKEARSND